MVQKGRRYAAIDVSKVSEAALRPVSLVCGATGDRAPSRPGPLHAGDRTPARASGLDDLTRVAAQCCHPMRRPGVSCDNGATARRARCSPSQAGEACAQRGLANLCRGTTNWRHYRSGRAPVPDPAVSWKGRRHRPRRIGDGQTHGARSRSPAACRSTFRMIRPCASAMRPSTRR
jgi:hypothetical protein